MTISYLWFGEQFEGSYLLSYQRRKVETILVTNAILSPMATGVPIYAALTEQSPSVEQGEFHFNLIL